MKEPFSLRPLRRIIDFLIICIFSFCGLGALFAYCTDARPEEHRPILVRIVKAEPTVACIAGTMTFAKPLSDPYAPNVSLCGYFGAVGDTVRLALYSDGHLEPSRIPLK